MKKIAIVCGAPSSEFLAPFDDDSWEIWVLGNRIDRFAGKRVTRIFEIHDDLSEHGDVAAYIAYLTSLNIPMVVGKAFPIEKAHIERFPFHLAEALFGSTYLTSSPAYMMACAILEEAKEIGVYGVDLSIDDHEYYWQRSCMEAWVGFAKGRGIKVHIPEVSSLGRSDYIEGDAAGGKPEFALPPFTQKEFEAMATIHRGKMDDIEQDIAKLQELFHSHDGARQCYERLAKVARAIEAGIKVTSLLDTVSLK